MLNRILKPCLNAELKHIYKERFKINVHFLKPHLHFLKPHFSQVSQYNKIIWRYLQTVISWKDVVKVVSELVLKYCNEGLFLANSHTHLGLLAYT